MSKLSDYLNITQEELEELDLDIQENKGSSGDMLYSYWFEVPESASSELMAAKGWEPKQIVYDIPIEVIHDDKEQPDFQ